MSDTNSDLDAAARSARSLASAVLTVCNLRAMGASEAMVQRFLCFADLDQLYPSARAAIAKVVMELQRTRTAAVRLGDITAPTAHQAALEMVRALNRQQWAGVAEVVGQTNVQNWPDRNTVMAEIELETNKARLFRAADSTVSAESERPAQSPEVPKWDRPSRQLTIGSEPVPIASREAPALFDILDLLEQAGWPANGVPVPQDFNHSVKDGVDALNNKLASTNLQILRLNNNHRIGWKLVSS